MTFDKPKPIIQKIKFPKEDQEYIDAMLEGKPAPNVIKYWADKGMNEDRRKRYTPPNLRATIDAFPTSVRITIGTGAT